MKYLAAILATLFFAVIPMTAQKASKNEKVTYCVSIDCQGCIDKITKELAFEKGVRDLQFSLEKKTVTVVYRADKPVDTDKWAEQIRKLGYEVSYLDERVAKPSETPSSNTDSPGHDHTH